MFDAQAFITEQATRPAAERLGLFLRLGFLPPDPERRSLNFLAHELEQGLAIYDALLLPPDLISLSPTIPTPDVFDKMRRLPGYGDREWEELKTRGKAAMEDFGK
jgi:hypothetical protein